MYKPLNLFELPDLYRTDIVLYVNITSNNNKEPIAEIDMDKLSIPFGEISSTIEVTIEIPNAIPIVLAIGSWKDKIKLQIVNVERKNTNVPIIVLWYFKIFDLYIFPKTQANESLIARIRIGSVNNISFCRNKET